MGASGTAFFGTRSVTLTGKFHPAEPPSLVQRTRYGPAFLVLRMRRQPPRFTLPLALALLALGGCARQATEGLPPGVDIEDLPDSEGWDARFRTSADGRPQIQVEAPYLARYTRDTATVYLGPPPGEASAAPVALRLFDAQGAPRGSIRAAEVWLYEADGRVVAQGRVRATLAEGDGATVEAARMTLEGARIDAQGGVRASVAGSDGSSVQAERLTMEDGRMEASGDVRASVQSGGGAQIQAARLVTRGGAFTASGGATVQIGGSAQSTVRARTVSGGGGRTTAEGGVRVQTSGGRTLEAGRVVWDEAAGRFSAPGAFSFDGPRKRVRGVGLSATSDLSRYSFRQVTGEIEVTE